MQTPEQESTCGLAALIEIDQLSPLLRRESANHHTRSGQVSFNERSHKLVIFAVESFGCLGKEGIEFVDGRTGVPLDQKVYLRSTFFRSYR